MKTRKITILAAGALLVLAGCGGEGSKTHFGLGSVAKYAYGTASYQAHVQTDIDYVAVALKGNVISHLRLDTVQIKANLVDGAFVAGSVVADTDGDVLSKWELLEDYGMLEQSTADGLGKEWYEQAEAFENFAIGKTVAQVKAAVGEDGSLTDGLTIGVSITVSGWVTALEDAVSNKVSVNGTISALGVGGLGALSVRNSVVNGHDFTIAGAAFDADHKVLAARVDTFQMRYAVGTGDAPKALMNESAVQVVAAENRIKGKHELKEDYGMLDQSIEDGLGKEWYEQAEALQAHLVGKTVSDALGSEDNLENGLTIGVTITVDGYRAALLEAEQTAFNSRIPA